MKTRKSILSVIYAIFTTILSVTCIIACSSNSQSTESKWKKVSSLEEFKQQFKGTTWESYDTYSYRIVVNPTGTGAKLYFNLHMPDRDEWSLQCECITDIYEMYSMYEGDCIRVALKANGDTKGSLHFKKDGTPMDFYDEKGGCFGQLHLVSNNWIDSIFENGVIFINEMSTMIIGEDGLEHPVTEVTFIYTGDDGNNLTAKLDKKTFDSLFEYVDE